MMEKRRIGIRHRVKKTASGEARPTQVSILENGKMKVLELEDEDAELDFALGRYPTKYRDLEDGEDRSQFLARHVKERRDKETNEVTCRVPATYDGLAFDDTVAMILGGSGDNFAFALSKRGEKIGATVLRIPADTLKQRRMGEKEEDNLLLAQLAKDEPGLFNPVLRHDRDLIAAREATFARLEIMKERIACGQRVRAQLVGRIFRSEDGLYPEGAIEEQYDLAKASDASYNALCKEESKRDRELSEALEKLPVYTEIFSNLEGCGPAISSRLIAAICDIRRFGSEAQLKKFCDAHVNPDGTFPRRRRGQKSAGNPLARQALYLLSDQWNRRPGSVWGAKLLHYKAKFRAKHPDVLEVGGKKRYTNGHILKMAKWRTITKFVEWLFREWTRLESSKKTANRLREMPLAVSAAI